MENLNQDTKRKIIITHPTDQSVRDMKEMKKKQIKNKKEIKFQSKDKSTFIRENDTKLKEIITKNKSKNLAKNFLNKLRLNSIYRTPASDLQSISREQIQKKTIFDSFKEKFQQYNGIKLGSNVLTLWSFFNIIHITTMVFIFSIMMTFPETTKNQTFIYLRIISVGLFFLDMILNFISERLEKGNIFKDIGSIGEFYLKNDFLVDFLSILGYTLDLFLSSDLILIVTFLSVVKLIRNKKKFQKFEYIYIGSSGQQQYYGLIKIFLTNFVIGHILSILLNLMANFSEKDNWWNKIDISKDQWYIKYIWGYYWGTNIMLTVGFGDLSANNHYEAIFLVFIETFSCITLAYNISYVGALLGAIREKEEEKKKKITFFHKMCKENQIPLELQSMIANYIEESYEIKENFCSDQYDEVLSSLPEKMQLQYRKQANKIVFDGLGFLNNLSKKTLLKMAQIVERKICYPNELILGKGKKSEFIILQKGKLCFSCKVNGANSVLEGKEIETLKVKEGQKPKMINLDFIRNKEVPYDLRSDKYSVIYRLSMERFKEALKSSDMDYQLYCVLRDRHRFILDEENLYQCEVCKNKFHSKFKCEKLHYIPIKQMVIYHNQMKNKRSPGFKCRLAKKPKRYLKKIASLRNDQWRLIEDYLGEKEKQCIQSILKYHDSCTTSKIKSIKQVQKKIQRFSLKSHGLNNNQTIQKLIKSGEVNQFWDLECDQAQNYAYYFINQNPNKFQTSQKFNKLKKSVFKETRRNKTQKRI